MATTSSDVLAEIRRAFAAADADGNGVITPDELFGASIRGLLLWRSVNWANGGEGVDFRGIWGRKWA